jgi:hypothetical protein
MWSYYGAKTNVIDHYPPPKEDKIIEPFAGTARYALKYFEKDVLIVDKYDVVINIWKWLQKCSKKDVLSLPNMKFREHVDDYTFDCIEAKQLMGFIIGFMTESPRKSATIRMQQRPNTINFTLNRISNNLHKIRHWEIRHGSFEDIKNEKATWFIDPPYVQGGQVYKCSNKNLDYLKLAQWCKSREGQTIVCEKHGANWLNFKPITTQKTRFGRQSEVIWSNYPTAFDNEQTKINY